MKRSKSRFSKPRSRLILSGLVVLPAIVAGCAHKDKGAPQAAITITRVPPSDPGGSQKMDYIAGRAEVSIPGQQVVVYTRSGGIWWVQPLAKSPFTTIQTDSTWKNTTHLGTEYAALQVNPG